MTSTGCWRRRAARVALALLAVALNAAVVGAPALALADRPLHMDWAPLLAVTALSLAVFTEVLLQQPSRRISSASSAERTAAFWSNFLQGLTLLLVLQWSLADSLSRGAGPLSAIGIVGLALMAAAIVLRATAIYTLGQGFGDHFSPVDEERHRRGPYRFLRHPAEVGLLLLAAGFVLTLGIASKAGLFLIPLLLLSGLRMRAEERALREVDHAK
jgi:protein-S-isoprenylcysteine O-methyltransferase Ste14